MPKVFSTSLVWLSVLFDISDMMPVIRMLLPEIYGDLRIGKGSFVQNHNDQYKLFLPNVTFLYPLKTSENLKVSQCF